MYASKQLHKETYIPRYPSGNVDKLIHHQVPIAYELYLYTHERNKRQLNYSLYTPTDTLPQSV
jgi:hypothetical protein